MKIDVEDRKSVSEWRTKASLHCWRQCVGWRQKPAHPCLLASLWVVFHKDDVCGRQVERPAAGLSLAWRPHQKTHIFHLRRHRFLNWRNFHIIQSSCHHVSNHHFLFLVLRLSISLLSQNNQRAVKNTTTNDFAIFLSIETATSTGPREIRWLPLSLRRYNLLQWLKNIECQHTNPVVKTTSVDVALVPMTDVGNRFGTGKTMAILLKTHI